MSIHLQREIDKLKRDLLLICSIVEEQVQKAIRALFDRDAGACPAKSQAMDDDVDRREIDLEEECLKTLALHQPVAIDLRQLIAALKINNDLERIGDMAVNIARKAAALAAEPAVEIPADFAEMGEQTQAMLRKSLDCPGADGRGAGPRRVRLRRRGRPVEAEDPRPDRGADPPAIRSGSAACCGCFPFPATWNGSPTAPRTSPRT